MSRPYNTKHPERGRSNYPARLSARGHNKAPQMPTLDHLRDMQNARIKRQGHPWPTWSELTEEAA